MQAAFDRSEPETESWLQIEPLLDAALAELGQKDHDAIVLRFFNDKSLREVGAALGASEDAAKVRVNRALEKLRKYFSRRGAISTTAIIASAISAHSIQAAPAVLAKSVTTVAASQGAAAGASTLALVKGALELMTWAKAKVAIVVAASTLVVAGTATVAVKEYRAEHISDEWWVNIDRIDFSKTPKVVVLRPTRFGNERPPLNSSRTTGRIDWTEPSSRGITAMIGKDMTIKEVLCNAYAAKHPLTRVLYPAGMPTTHYDYLANVPNLPAEKLQAKIRDQLGYTAHTELRETNVLLLRLVKPELLNAKAVPGSSMVWFNQTQPLSTIAGDWETLLDTPILDLTGSTNRYDPATMRVQFIHNLKRFNDYVIADLGLELVPRRAQVEMLVVERIK